MSIVRKNVAVVGAGIVGLSHAWMAAERGHRVTVFERSSKAEGASIRNFGMVWPIGQPTGELYAVAMRSRRRWLALSDVGAVASAPLGSIHLAHRSDEWAVLQEFAQKAGNFNVECQLLNPEEVCQKSSIANPKNLLGGLFSPTELCVNPPAAMMGIVRYLAEQHQVGFQFHTTVVEVESGRLRTSKGETHEFDQILVCSGADAQTLFPGQFATSGMLRCKLQMLKSVRLPSSLKRGPHLASGLTLRHYRNFEICSSLFSLRQRIATETPELNEYGIHVMASMQEDGSLILGDSHEYGEAIEPFDKVRIEELILRELKTILALPDWTVSERWHGIYVKHPNLPVFAAEPCPGVFLRTGTGGSGMTMAFGLAEQDWEHWT